MNCQLATKIHLITTYLTTNKKGTKKNAKLRSLIRPSKNRLQNNCQSVIQTITSNSFNNWHKKVMITCNACLNQATSQNFLPINNKTKQHPISIFKEKRFKIYLKAWTRALF